MTAAMHFPGPRGSLDDGSLAELVQDSREVEIDVSAARPWAAKGYGPVEFPDDASALIDGFAAYGG